MSKVGQGRRRRGRCGRNCSGRLGRERLLRTRLGAESRARCPESLACCARFVRAQAVAA